MSGTEAPKVNLFPKNPPNVSLQSPENQNSVCLHCGRCQHCGQPKPVEYLPTTGTWPTWPNGTWILDTGTFISGAPITITSTSSFNS